MSCLRPPPSPRRRERPGGWVRVGNALEGGVASRSPGTCRESLWLLPSGPDQVHDHAMRGDPPLIVCRGEQGTIIGHSDLLGQGTAGFPYTTEARPEDCRVFRTPAVARRYNR